MRIKKYSRWRHLQEWTVQVLLLVDGTFGMTVIAGSGEEDPRRHVDHTQRCYFAVSVHRAYN